MAVRTPKFAAIPNIPQTGVDNWQYYTLSAMKENIEQLAGLRGGDASNQAITRGAVTVSNAPTPVMQRVSAAGTGYTIGGASVPALEDYIKLVTDVQQLANDVSALNNTVNALIAQLRG